MFASNMIPSYAKIGLFFLSRTDQQDDVKKHFMFDMESSSLSDDIGAPRYW